MKTLIIEDEYDLAETIANFLSSQGNEVSTANTIESARTLIKQNTFDIVLLDITLPDGSGLDLVELIKERNKNGGLIIVSARDKIEQKVEGLEKGADDYITKPFHLSELNARIKSLGRRARKEASNILVHNEIKLNLDSYQVFINNEEIKLTKTEIELLNYFISNKNRVLTKTSICKHINKANAFEFNFSDDFIYTHIKNLRKKLIAAKSKDYINTVYGVGYKFI